MARKGSLPDRPASAPDSAPDTAPDDLVVIAVEPVEWDRAGLPEGARIVKIPFRALTKPLLSETRPAIVLGPLVSPSLDAMQIAERLGELGYHGTLLLLGPVLPNPSLVAREIRAASGSKDIKVELVAPS